MSSNNKYGDQKVIKHRCERCNEQLETVVWLEFSITDGNYYEQIPEGHMSQGSFPFGTTCAKKQLLETKQTKW